jgi:cytochrome c oxidase cbb3-type subunit 1
MSQASSQNPAIDAARRAEIDRSLRHPVMFFFTSGAAWLAVAILLGIISSAKVHSPGFLDGCSFLTYGRVQPAHMSALIYGWACQAAFGMLVWLMARLSRQECRAAGIILTAGHVWNFAVGLGVVGILAGKGTGVPWMEFPVFAWVPMLLAYAAIGIWSMVQFKVRPAGHVFVSQWYILAALIWFPWVFATAHLLIHGFSGSPLMANAVNAWFRSGLLFLFFTRPPSPPPTT